MKLEKYLYRFLFEYDRIVVPNFGTFFAKQSPTSYTDNYTQIKPKRKIVSFSSDFVEDDFLVTKIAELEGISLQQAINFVEKEVENWFFELQSKHEMRLERIGDIFRNHKDDLYFSPKEDENFSFDSYGLTPADYPIKQIPAKKASLAVRLLKYFLIFVAIVAINLVTVNQYLVHIKNTSLKEFADCLYHNNPQFDFINCNPFSNNKNLETKYNSLESNLSNEQSTENDTINAERDSTNTTDDLFFEADSL